MTTYKDIISFWFEEVTPQQWFTKDVDFDELIKSRFLDTYKQAVAGELSHWRDTATGRLAEIIVIDQFARNIFRNQPQAFAHDSLALILVQEGIRIGADQEIPTERRSFFYMPLMHSESKLIHEQALKVFKELGNPQNLEYEIKHKEIIDQFGRYPHRNQILGRQSTPAELEFLKTHNGF